MPVLHIYRTQTWSSLWLQMPWQLTSLNHQQTPQGLQRHTQCLTYLTISMTWCNHYLWWWCYWKLTIRYKKFFLNLSALHGLIHSLNWDQSYLSYLPKVRSRSLSGDSVLQMKHGMFSGFTGTSEIRDKVHNQIASSFISILTMHS